MNNETYVLPEKTPSKNTAVSYMLGGIMLIALGWFIGGAAAFGLGALGLAGIAVGTVQYFSKPAQTVLLNEQRIAIQSAGRTREIPFSLVEKIELIRVADGKVQRIPLQQVRSFTFDKKDVLTVTGTNGQRLEISASGFGASDFESLIYALQTKIDESGVLPDISQYDALIAENLQYMRKDAQLKEALTENLTAVFKALYVPRGELYMKEHPQANVLFKYQPNPNEGAIYFLENDYQPGLDPQAIQQGKQMLLQTQKNIETVNKRMEAYRQIADQLTRMKEKLLARRKLAQAAGTLNALQNQNRRGAETFDDHDFQVTAFRQLKQLTADLNGIQDLGSASVLAEVDRILGNG